MVAFCRPLLAALALLTAAIAVSVSPASARPHHGVTRHTHAYQHIGHQVRWQHAQYHSNYRHRYAVRRATTQVPSPSYASVTPDTGSTTRIVRYQPRRAHRPAVQQARRERDVAVIKVRGLADTYAGIVPNTGGVTFESVAPSVSSIVASSGSSLVSEARRYLGGNPTGRGSLWCARFMNMVLQHTGHKGTGSDMANSFAHYGTRVSGPQVGAIAVMTRGRSGGHVGIITGVDAKGNPIMISGNNGNRVREAPVSRGRIYAYVMPN
jgi:uncharacterized protein (TIGR02594 family)